MVDITATWVIVIIGTWFAIGLATALVLGRRGHDAFSWFVLGALLGPFALALAAGALRDEQRSPRQLQGSRPQAGGRPGVDVLVGYDGSPESEACVTRTVEVFGHQLRNLTVATVVPFDCGEATETLATAALAGVANRLVGSVAIEPHLLLLHGHPATALTEQALEDGAAVLAIGTRGAGGHLFGSAASELAKSVRVPVLLVGPPASSTEGP